MLAYETYGKGKPLVLLHAFPLSRKMWEPQKDFFSDKFKIITPDLPGFGESRPLGKPSIEGGAKELATLLDFLKIEEPVFLAGLSMGGYVALEFLRQFPERKVSGLALLSSRASADDAGAKEKRFLGIETIKQHGLRPYARKLVGMLLGKTTQEKNKGLLDKVLEMVMANPPEAVMDALLALAERRDQTQMLPELKIPVLIMVGEEDSAIVVDEGRAMQPQIPDSEFRMIHQAGHFINLEKPEAFNYELADFMKRRL